nr:equilibrative nucleotide transporter 3-like [Quercus suber]
MANDNSEAPIRLEHGKSEAMVVCGILGLGCLVSWNSLLTIGDYYYELVSDPSRVLTLVYQPFAFATTAVLTYKEAKINTRWWNLIGYTLFFASTLSLLVLDLATSGKGGVGPYIGICVIVCFIGVASANVQGGMVGELSFMLPELIQSFLAGWAAAGTLTSVLRLLTKAAFEKSNNGLCKDALLFLAISTFITFLCFILYASYFPSLPIVVYYRSKAASEGSKTVSSDLAAAGIQAEANQEVEGNATPQQRLSIKQLFFQNIDYALDLFLIYAMTLSIFPGFIFENTGAHQLGSWYPLVLITMFNAWDFIARYIPLVQCLKIGSRKGLMIAVLSRFLLIPAYYFTAKYGDQGWMIILTSFLGISNGYLTVCILKIAPKGYKGPEQNALGNMLVLCLLNDNDETNSTSGYVLNLDGGAISWKSSNQTCNARSTMESEFVALENAGTEAEWLRNLLADIPKWDKPLPSISLHCDSQAAIACARNKIYNGKKRHIHLRHNIVRQLISNGVIAMELVRSEKNLADPLTKGLTRQSVYDTSREMGLKPIE